MLPQDIPVLDQVICLNPSHDDQHTRALRSEIALLSDVPLLRKEDISVAISPRTWEIRLELNYPLQVGKAVRSGLATRGIHAAAHGNYVWVPIRSVLQAGLQIPSNLPVVGDTLQ